MTTLSVKEATEARLKAEVAERTAKYLAKGAPKSIGEILNSPKPVFIGMGSLTLLVIGAMVCMKLAHTAYQLLVYVDITKLL